MLSIPGSHSSSACTQQPMCSHFQPWPSLQQIVSLKLILSHSNICLHSLYFYLFIYFIYFFTILYWFCHTSTWIHHGCTSVPHPEAPSHVPPCTVPLGHPSAPAPSILYPASNLDCQFISYMILYMFQCHSPKSPHPLPLPQSPKDCSIHLCLFCYLAYRVIVTIFLNSICMR